METARWHCIDRVFQLVLDHDEDERPALLDTACAGDPELRRAVESLLDHERDLPAWLDADRRPATAAAATEGDVLGAWRLGRRLGEGGMSIVFEAARVDGAYDRRVAVKILKQALPSRRALDRFDTECRILARLEHPGIARLYDAATTGRGLPYLVMERIDGERLDVWARSRPAAERLAVFEQVAEAVAFAHRNLVVHRDLKPSNVLVDAAGKPRLLDFGIARPLGDNSLDATRLTRTDQQPMTPQYASPEQLRGKDVSTASDIYSLGMILYELLTDRLPYRIDHGSPSEIARLLDHGPTIRAPSATVRETNPTPAGRRLAATLRGDLDAIVRTALAEEPARRYPSADALLGDLRRHRQGLPIHARPPSTSYLVRRFVARHRLAVASIALLVLAGLVFTAMTLANARRLAIERNRAHDEAATAREVVRFLGGLFEGAEPDIHQGHELTAREILDRGAAALDHDAARAPRTHAALAAAIGKAYLELGAYAEAGPFLETSLALRSAFEINDPAAVAESRLLLARLAFHESSYALARDHAALAVQGFESADTEAPALARAYFELGRARARVGDPASGRDALRRGLDVLDTAAVESRALRGLLECGLGGVQLMLGRHPSEARPQIEKGLALLVAEHGQLHPDVFGCRRSLAFSRPADGELELLTDLLADQRQLFGTAHEQIAWGLVDLAGVLVSMNHFDQAAGHYEEALAMADNLFPDGHFVLAPIHAGLALSLDQSGEPVAALAHYRKAVEVAREHLDPKSADLAVPLFQLGDALRRQSRCTDAIPYLEEAYLGFRRVPEGQLWRVQTMVVLGFCLETTGVRGQGRALAHAAAREWRRGTSNRTLPEELERLICETEALSGRV